MRIDAHQHFWTYDPAQYGWIRPGTMDVLRRDYHPADLAAELDGVELDASIAVQARQSLEESRWLLELAEANPRVAGVVGWADLRSDRVGESLAELSRHPKFMGVRHVVQDEPDDNFMLGREFQHGIAHLQPLGLTYDILVYARQLPAAIQLVQAFPDQPFVLDHIAKPMIREGVMSPWREQVRELAKAGNVCCKVSGMVTEADWQAWTPADFRPYLDEILEAFGTSRLMFGSDWPVCLCAASYQKVHSLAAKYVSQFSAEEQEAFFGGNACTFYGLSTQPQGLDKEGAS